MKRQQELLTQILKLLEDSDKSALSANRIRKTIAGDDDAKQEEVTHHLFILGDAGYIDISNPGAIRLTWQGHDELEKGQKRLSTKVTGLSI